MIDVVGHAWCSSAESSSRCVTFRMGCRLLAWRHVTAMHIETIPLNKSSAKENDGLPD
jgi:hypothetical protein